MDDTQSAQTEKLFECLSTMAGQIDKLTLIAGTCNTGAPCT